MQQKLKRRPFGRTGLMVTELGFGAMNLRMLGSHEEARALVHHVLDQGVNLIDTARAYKGEIAPGVLLESEKIVGEVLRARPAPSEPLVIITKGSEGAGRARSTSPTIFSHSSSTPGPISPL